jgi:hypothetical protein
MLAASHDRYKHIYEAAVHALTTYDTCTFIAYIYPGYPASTNPYSVCRTIDLALSRRYELTPHVVFEGSLGLQRSHQASSDNA